MPSVITFQRVRIIKDLCRLSETDAVHFQIPDGLFIIPLKSHE